MTQKSRPAILQFPAQPQRVSAWKPANNEDICLEYYAKHSVTSKKDMEKELASCLISKP